MKAYAEILVFIEQWIQQHINFAGSIQLDVSRKFADYGVDSGQYASLAEALSDYIHKRISPLFLLQTKNIQAFVEFVLSDKPFPDYDAITIQYSQSDSANRTYFEPVAIIGMSCCFPQCANVEEFWELLLANRTAITAPNDWRKQRFHWDKIPENQRIFFNAGYVDKLDEFDHHFFGISQLNAASMDPQQRVLLETSYHALEHAGLTLEEISGKLIGVSIGIYSDDFALNQFSTDIENQFGNLFALAANNVSHFYNLTGPSVAMDTACSSAVHAILNACRYLHDGSANVMLAGGVNFILDPKKTIAYGKANMLSPNGVCAPFDVKANGFVRGEGAGWVVLKRYEDAVGDGDRIISVIVGGAENQDGKTSSVAAPNPVAQTQLLKQACKSANVSPADIIYIEAHGTGTPLGDPIEAKAIGDVFGHKRRENSCCYIGSVKTNIGHLESAAGLAGLIKASLCLQHQLIPGNPHFSSLNPLIEFNEAIFQVPQHNVKWPEMIDGINNQYATVSGFGIGGSNAHLVITSLQGMQTRDEAARSISAVHPLDHLSHLENSEPTVFLCSGVGGEWERMGRKLYLQESTYRQVIHEASDALDHLCSNNLIEFIFNDSPTKFKENPYLVFPSILSLQIGVSKLLEQRGILPTAVIGHSLGEYSAAHISGMVDFKQALTYAYHAGCFHLSHQDRDTMLMVYDTKERILSLMTRYTGSLWIAGEYDQRVLLISGVANSIQRFSKALINNKVYFKRISSVMSAHHFEAEIPVFIANATDTILCSPNIQYYSCMLGGIIDPQTICLKDLLYLSIKPIQYFKTISSFIEDYKERKPHILEVNSHPVMSNNLKSIAKHLNADLIVSHTLLKEKESIRPTNLMTQVDVNSRSTAQNQAEFMWLPFVFSAQSEKSLIEFIQLMYHFLSQTTFDLMQLSYHLAVYRTAFSHKISFICKTRTELLSACDQFLVAPLVNKFLSEQKKIAFVFAGQGNQWTGLGQDLYESDLSFRSFVLECQSHLSLIAPELFLTKFFNGSLSVTAVLDNAMIQVILFIVQFWLALRMVAFGIQPDVVCGHSMGEVAAACFAGLIDFPTAIYLIYHRGQAVNHSAKEGAMLVVNLPSNQLSEDLSHFSRLWIAAENSPSWTVVSGDLTQIHLLVDILIQRNIAHKILEQDYAFHTPYMQKGAEYLQEKIALIPYHEPQIPMFSTVTGNLFTQNEVGSSYWAQNLSAPVKFKQCVSNMLSHEVDVFIELGPHAILSASVREIAQIQQKEIKMLSALVRGVSYRKTFLDILVYLFQGGVPIRWSEFYDTQQKKMDLPLYCWTHESKQVGESVTGLDFSCHEENEDELLEIVMNLWQEILVVHDLRADVDMSIYQVNSLNIIQFITRVRAFFGIELTISELTNFRTMKALSYYLGEKLLEIA